MHLVGFIIRIFHDALWTERQIITNGVIVLFLSTLKLLAWYFQKN